MENKKYKAILKCLLLVAITSCFPYNLCAQETSSPLYKINGATFGTGGTETQSPSGLRILPSIGSDISGERFDSLLYSLGGGSNNAWKANVPLVSCFETISEGGTSCADPDVVPSGMVMLCGEGGCYNRGRFEIDSQNNPIDALYSIQVTTDPAWSFGTWSYLSNAFTLKQYTLHNLNDYQTESYWEDTVNFNITGLIPGQIYYLRATALHGDFTESGTSPTVSATTSYPSITFDIDIAENNIETPSPYSINFGLLKTTSVSTAKDLIWIDIGTNATNGAVVDISDTNNGLFNTLTGETIPSSSTNLDTTFPGFGLAQQSSTQTFLGPLSVTSDFGNAGNIVGGLSSIPSTIYTTGSGPIYRGRGSLFAKARASSDISAGALYYDQIIFRVIGNY